MATLQQVAMDLGMYTVPDQILEHFVENYQNKSFTVKDLKKDKFFKQTAKKPVKKSSPKKSSTKKPVSSPKESLEDRQSGCVIENKCQCRIWKVGLDSIQCSGNKKDGTDYCGRHIKKGACEGKWWLGNISDPRPEEPYLDPENPKSRHYWSDQTQPEKKKSAPKKKQVKVEKPEKPKKQKKQNKQKKVEKVEKIEVDSDNESVTSTVEIDFSMVKNIQDLVGDLVEKALSESDEEKEEVAEEKEEEVAEEKEVEKEEDGYDTDETLDTDPNEYAHIPITNNDDEDDGANEVIQVSSDEEESEDESEDESESESESEDE
jgi:hypothetical protein